MNSTETNKSKQTGSVKPRVLNGLNLMQILSLRSTEKEAPIPSSSEVFPIASRAKVIGKVIVNISATQPHPVHVVFKEETNLPRGIRKKDHPEENLSKVHVASVKTQNTASKMNESMNTIRT